LGVVRPKLEAELRASAAGAIRYSESFESGLESGARIESGELLARVDNPEILRQLRESQALARAAAADLERHERAFELGVGTGNLVARAREEVDLARVRLQGTMGLASALEIRSPIDGLLVIEELPPEGSAVAGGDLVARVVETSRLVVRGTASAADRVLLEPGLMARFLVEGGREPLEVGTGSISSVEPEVGRGGTLGFSVDVSDGARLPAVGEGVVVSIELGLRRDALVIPSEAIYTSAESSSVFIVQRDLGLRAKKRIVQLGLSSGGKVEVLSGLNEGDEVVVDGRDFLSDGSAVVVVTGSRESP
jgi:RND family efflux transporter MFP subunit